ncbi:hypothetical protein S141_61 [Shewanella sp. phage 1/41]|uniref:hypothetical protein n=1 Tax=Shewanella sp. phage 1/41 TaxID=1458861 RepID=UPI0004F829DA|nr:hypothetical protein S141_61 [Shewanella sp. phage 1/41]AHK11707.1 hypothetical protein S141_61 [Shewanella sp. phage 1/41]
MAKIRQAIDAMEKQDRENYLLGNGCNKHAENPHNDITEIRKHQAWSAGHFDKWGRV